MKLKKLWDLDGKYSNVIRLIDYLNKNPRIEHLGGGTVVLKVKRGRSVARRNSRDKSLYIGIPNLKISPLRWFWLLSKHLDRLPTYLFNDLERVVGDILHMISKSQPPGR